MAGPKLQDAERIDLEELLEHPGMKPLWKEADECLRLIERDVLQYNLSTGTPEQLVHTKARAEGAARLLSAMKNRLQNQSPKNKVTE